MSVQQTQVETARRKQAARHAAEAARIAVVADRGAVPDGCGPEIIPAPARGAVVRFMPVKAYPDGDHGHKFKPAGYQGRKAIRRADVFDQMSQRALAKGSSAPFTPAQIAMAREYQALVERHASAGVRCSSLEAAVQSSGGGSGEWIDAVLDDRARIKRIQSSIGDGTAMIVRRQRPSARGCRTDIPDRRLVDMICLEGATLSGVLATFGWSARDGGQIKVLTLALCDALDRMAGLDKPAKGGVIHYGDHPR